MPSGACKSCSSEGSRSLGWLLESSDFPQPVRPDSAQLPAGGLAARSLQEER